MFETVLVAFLGLVIAAATFFGGVAVGKIDASRERGDDPNQARVSVKEIVNPNGAAKTS